MAGVVRMACQDCTGAVELFGQNEAGEVMGQGDGAEREQETGMGTEMVLNLIQHAWGPAVSGADGENEALGALVAAGGKPGSEFG